jgi:hypothetical protein
MCQKAGVKSGYQAQLSKAEAYATYQGGWLVSYGISAIPYMRGPWESDFIQGGNVKATKLRFRTEGYVSEFEAYLDQFKREHPHVEQDQRRGWEIWWDRRPVQDELAVRRADSVPVQGYKYK